MDHYDLLRRMFFGPGLWKATSGSRVRPEEPQPLDLRRLTTPERPVAPKVDLVWKEEEPLGA